ncbi:hypothetical protein C4552_04575 [Candidatus Parcubacteria bacterium]|nr:MAG: hypothetical protein C4552_04575 [Candidatus Parcubacteria bacterium]
MAFLIPLLAALSQASSVTLDKVILGMRRVDFRDYTGVSFPLLFVITLAAYLLLRPPFEPELLMGSFGLFLAASAGLMIITNILYYRALDRDQLGEIETFALLAGIPTIVVTSILFADERNPAVLIPALVAAGAVAWSHWERRHFAIARSTLPFFLWALAAAPLQAALIKVLLAAWHPVSLELVRSALAAAVFAILYGRAARTISAKTFWALVITNVLSAIAWLLLYTSYQRSGIVYSALLFSLQPLLVYAAALVVLKERFAWKKVLAFHVVIMAIAVAEILRRY